MTLVIGMCKDFSLWMKKKRQSRENIAQTKPILTDLKKKFVFRATQK